MLDYMHRIAAAKKDEKGASAVEYGLLVALIAAVIVLVVLALGGLLKTAFKDTCKGIDDGLTSTSATACN